MVGGDDTDAGAVIGQHDDERQQLVGRRAARLSLTVVLFAIVILCVIAAAAHYAIWPFEVLVVVIAISYFVGLGFYGVDPDAEAEDVGRSRFGWKLPPPQDHIDGDAADSGRLVEQTRLTRHGPRRPRP